MRFCLVAKSVYLADFVEDGCAPPRFISLFIVYVPGICVFVLSLLVDSHHSFRLVHLSAFQGAQRFNIMYIF